MHLQKQINHQRIKHIIQSYRLEGEETDSFTQALEHLLIRYPTVLIELALVETLVDHWAFPPLPRGQAFLTKVRHRLILWENHPVISTLTPQQFEQITGLNPQPIYGPSESTPSSSYASS